jgi:hypothetical protein
MTGSRFSKPLGGRKEKEKERKARRVSRFYSTPHETTATKICKGPVLVGTVVLPMENKR